jgi:predicted kinase
LWLVIDNTNPTKADRERYIAPAKKAGGYEIIGYYFMTDLERAMKRNESRDRVVPKIGIYATLKKLERPSFAEGFDRLYFRITNSLSRNGKNEKSRRSHERLL